MGIDINYFTATLFGCKLFITVANKPLIPDLSVQNIFFIPVLWYGEHQTQTHKSPGVLSTELTFWLDFTLLSHN